MKNFKKKGKKQNKNPWFCDGVFPDGKICGVFLGDRIDENKIIISGLNGQEYEICFNYIDLVCKKCGKANKIYSSTMEDIFNLAIKGNSQVIRYREAFILDTLKRTPELMKILQPKKSVFKLSSNDRNKLLKKLSESQKKIYKILSEKRGKEANFSKNGLSDVLEEIYKETGLKMQKIFNDIDAIIKEIREVKNISLKSS